MTGDPLKLDQIQKWMQSVITHPEGISAGLQSAFAQEQIPLSPDRVGEVVAPSKRLASTDRLRIYGHAYYARLMECLRDEFPAVAHALGQETFDAYVMGYLQSYPSTSYTLGELGANFPRFLSEIPIQAPDGTPENFTEFLADLATLERCYSEVFDGPGSENVKPLAAEDFQNIPPENWPGLRLLPTPSLRFLQFRFPVHEYVSSVRRDEPAALPAAQTIHLVVNRRDFVVRRVALDPLPFSLLFRLAKEELPLGPAIEKTLDDAEADFDELAEQLPSWFRDWAGWRFFDRLEFPR